MVSSQSVPFSSTYTHIAGQLANLPTTSPVKASVKASFQTDLGMGSDVLDDIASFMKEMENASAVAPAHPQDHHAHHGTCFTPTHDSDVSTCLMSAQIGSGVGPRMTALHAFCCYETKNVMQHWSVLAL